MRLMIVIRMVWGYISTMLGIAGGGVWGVCTRTCKGRRCGVRVHHEILLVSSLTVPEVYGENEKIAIDVCPDHSEQFSSRNRNLHSRNFMSSFIIYSQSD